LLEIKQSAFEYYRNNVRGNETISYEQAQKKLTRNVILAAERKRLKNFIRCEQEYVYGCLKIIVRFGTIVEIENYITDIVLDWTKDEEKYEQITKELGITEDKKVKKRKYIY
jgi:hypothetical protein